MQIENQKKFVPDAVEEEAYEPSGEKHRDLKSIAQDTEDEKAAGTNEKLTLTDYNF